MLRIFAISAIALGASAAETTPLQAGLEARGANAPVADSDFKQTLAQKATRRRCEYGAGWRWSS
jgi:hypothetical protein